MKKLFLSFLAFLLVAVSRADEGMWLPMLIGKNYEEMKRMGLKLSQEDLYSINRSSLKDAIVQFNGGCTGEMISGTGLLITNHHCGYGAIAALSSVEKNYLDNGFWAYSHEQELPAKGVYVIFLDHVEDVTAEVGKAVGKATGDKFNRKFEEIKKKIEERESRNGMYVAHLKEYFSGNQYLVLVYKKYTDVRLVGTPPKSLGKYGGDTDNWMWPRHTADFSVFRVYANKSNEPAEYDAANVPYKPKKFLPISAKGVQEGDFAMIFGYPGRTNRYEVSYGVDLAISDINPSIVRIREKRLAIMKRHMNADKSVYLKLTSTYASVSNYWKYFIGQTEQLKRLKTVDQKAAQEQEFIKWASKNAKEYNTLMNEYSAMYSNYKPYAKHNVYFSEAFKAPVLSRLGAALEPLYRELSKEKPNQDSVKKHTDALKTTRKTLMKVYDPATDEELLAAMTQMYYRDVPRSQLPDIYQKMIFSRYGNENADKTFGDYAAHLYSSTFLLNDEQFGSFVNEPTKEMIEKDPAAQYALSFVQNFNKYYQPKADAYNNRKKELSKKYLAGLMKMRSGQLMYPDANSTMRITYGQVKGYTPKDAVAYSYFTTLDGFMEKYKPGDDEFDAPKDLVELYRKKDYGRYADKDGTLHACFITTNDITGGNSGSPVINGSGEWIGIAFDGNWEAMSGDIAFDRQYKRTICTDARFILFVIDRMGHATNLIEEMEIHN